MANTKPRRFTRYATLAPDARVEAIQQAVRACDPAGRRRAHVMSGDYAWPEHYVAMLDEMRLYGVPDEQIMAVGAAMRDAAMASTTDPVEPLSDLLALESVAQGEADRDAAKLLDDPRCPSRLQRLARALGFHRDRAELARRAALRDASAFSRRASSRSAS